MNTSNFKFTLDLQSTQSQIAIPVTLGDTARTWLISFRDGSSTYKISDGCLAKLEIMRPTGTHIEEFCPIEHNTTVRYSFLQNPNTAAVEGFHECAVVLYDEEGHIIGSPRFSMIVSGRVINSDSIKLSDETKLSVDSMITEEASRRNAEVARANAESERISAEATRAESEAQRTLNEAARQTADSERSLAEESRNKRFEALQTEANKTVASLTSPTVTIQSIENGNKVTVTDRKGEHTFSIMNGTDGKHAYDYALDGGYEGTEAEFIAKMVRECPTKLSELVNDNNFITASEAPVQSVNGQTGAITLSHSDVGAEASGSIAEHNNSIRPHKNIFILIESLTSRLNALADSDDETLDQLSEIVAYIKSNQSLIDGITTSKVNVSDIVDDLSSNVANKPLSAAQGVALNARIDNLKIPSKISDLTNDGTFVQSSTNITMTAVGKDGVTYTYTIYGKGL